MIKHHGDHVLWEINPEAIPLGTYTLGDRIYDLGWVPPTPLPGPLFRLEGMDSPFPFAVWGPGVLDYASGWNMGPYGSIHFAALIAEIERRLEVLRED